MKIQFLILVLLISLSVMSCTAIKQKIINPIGCNTTQQDRSYTNIRIYQTVAPVLGGPCDKELVGKILPSIPTYATWPKKQEDPDVPTDLQFKYYIVVRGDNPTTKELIRPITTKDSQYVYPIGSFQGGENIVISFYNKENKLLAERKIIVRPGDYSYRSGFIIAGDKNVGIQPVFGVDARFSRNTLADINFPVLTLAVGLPSKDKARAYAVGIGFEFVDVLNIQYGIAYFESEGVPRFTNYRGATVDLSIFQWLFKGLEPK